MRFVWQGWIIRTATRSAATGRAVLGPQGRQTLAELNPSEELFGWKVATEEGGG